MGRHLSKELTKVIALPDCHIPHNIRLKPIEDFIEDWQPDTIILLGDFMNLDPVSHWIIDKKRLVEGKRLKEEYYLANLQIQRFKELSNAKIVFTIGNHCNWIEQYIDKHPEMEGLIELKEHIKGIDEWVDFNKTYKVGKLWYTHGLYTNEFHTKKTALNMGVNIIYGHTHDIQNYTTVAPQDRQGHSAKSIGCLCSEDLPYMKNRPNKWINAFNYAYIREDGSFNDYTVVLTNGRFTAEGKTYS